MTEIITSTGNPRVKEALRLRGKRGRAEGEHILIDGVREIGRAVEAGIGIDEVFFCDAILAGDDAAALLKSIAAGGSRVTQVSETVFDKIRYGDRTGGLVTIAQRPRRALDDLRLSSNPLVAVLERLEKPGNLGAIVRTADAAGVEAILVIDPETDLYGPNVIRASLGTIFCLPVVEAEVDAAIAWIKKRNLAMIAATPEGAAVYTDVDFRGPVALVFGSEAKGLSTTWRKPNVTLATVPMRGRADSLNVATTAALFFYEALRQRGAVQ
ncbi:MAG TPA: RNA methyltransferase [Phycisphaerae bacterium]|nr:RNA methyltransferase [Phycisphaerae bacterium]